LAPAPSGAIATLPTATLSSRRDSSVSNDGTADEHVRIVSSGFASLSRELLQAQLQYVFLL
jgi:hypothetical protein